MSMNSNLVDLQNPHFDAVSVTYPDTVTEIYSFRKGGLTGGIALVVTIVYTDATKALVSSIVRTPQRT